MELQRQSIIIGAPSALGQEIPGVEIAPQALRMTGLVDKIKSLGFRVEDAGDVEIPLGVATRKNGERLMSPEECSQACEKIHNTVYKYARDRDNFITIIGGDHSIALGSVSGIMKARPDTCVIWVDAHADINTPETSGSGHIHGMPVAGLVGEFDAKSVPGLSWLEPCLRPDRIVFIGLRDVDEGERKILKKLNIKAFSMTEVDKLGMPEVVKQALDHVNPQRDRPIHLSFDIDGIDPYYAPSTGKFIEGSL
jgi:arginase